MFLLVDMFSNALQIQRYGISDTAVATKEKDLYIFLLSLSAHPTIQTSFFYLRCHRPGNPRKDRRASVQLI
mgnify:CR=1 FL=1